MSAENDQLPPGSMFESEPMQGLTERNYFAGLVMQSILARIGLTSDLIDNVANESFHFADAMLKASGKPFMKNKVSIVFDGPPGPEGGRFVDVEVEGKSVDAGEWIEKEDSIWELVLDSDIFTEGKL